VAEAGELLIPVWRGIPFLDFHPFFVQPEHFYGLVFGHAQFVIEHSSIMVALFSPFPEFPRVVTGKHGGIFLALVAEDGIALDDDFLGAQGNRHINIGNIPFLPGTAVEPQAAIACPRPVTELFQCFDNGGIANAVCAVWIA